MRGRKKKELTNGLKQNNVVQKSNALFSLWKSNITLSEFKILDTYLSRIDSHKPEQRKIIFSKGEIEKLLGVQRIRKEQLNERLKHLMSNVVEVTDKDETKGFKLITLFEEADAEQDSNGQWQVRLECTKKAMKYIFNIENLGYLRYKLQSIINITSLYSYILFTYIEYNRFRKTWEIELDELKELMNCNSDTYNQYYRFNDLILKKVHKELNTKTNCKYSYEAIYTGRRATKIRFTVDTDNIQELITETYTREQQELQELITDTREIQENTTDSNTTELQEINTVDTVTTVNTVNTVNTVEKLNEADETNNEYQNEMIELLAESCNYEFDNDEMLILFSILATSNKIVTKLNQSLELARYDYLLKKYREMNYYNRKHIINNRFAYYRKMIENDLK